MADSLDLENRILLACARTKLTEKHQSQISELVQSPVDWDSLVLLANHHKLLPLLYKHLLNICPNKIPSLTMERLRVFYNNNTLMNLHKLTELIQIDNLFKQNNIQLVSVKGPLLTLEYFDNIALRCFCDIDILVSKEVFKKASLLMRSLGYIYLPEGIPEQYFLKFSKLSHHGQLINKNNTLVELHWNLSGQLGAKSLKIETLAPFLQTREIHGYELLTLNKELLLVYLALHAQRHSWQKYDYLLCIAELLNKTPSIDWSIVTELAIMLKIEKVVTLAVFMAHTLLDASLDHKIIKKSKFSDLLPKITKKHLANWQLINQLIIKRTKSREKKWKTVYPLTLQFAGRISDVIYPFYSKNFLPDSSDWERFPIPYRLNTIYYFYHPIYKLSQLIRRLQ